MNLFWKLFVSVGIAMALTLVGAVYVSFRITTLAFDQFNIENREIILSRAAEALDEGGAEGLRSWLARNPSPAPGLLVMILDDSGTDLLGRELPPRFQRFLESGFRPRRSGPRNFRPPQLTATLVSPSGEEFRLLFVRTRITFLGVLTWPATQLAVLVLAVLAAAVTAFVLARYLASPIARLRRATHALAAGALDTRVGAPFVRRNDEVGTLARDFDAMAEQIQTLVNDKELLMRDVSHELRSPLARIRVALALAERKAGDAARPDLERIEREAERLDGLIGQILTLTRLRSGPGGLDSEVDLAELVSEVVADVRFEDTRARIQCAIDDVPPVLGTRSELKSAIENVIRNAVIHSGPERDIEVRLRRRGQEIEIAVADRGPGVAEADLKRIFEPFYRADESRDHKIDGFGLGLAIAASVVARHGGRITGSNRAGGGLEIMLALPLEPD